MPSQFDSQVDQMQAASRHVTDVNQRIHQMIGSLRSEVGTVGSHFHGSAAQTFQQLMSRYDDDSNKLNQALQQISELIQSAGKNYHSTDESSSQALRGAGSSLSM